MVFHLNTDLAFFVWADRNTAEDGMDAGYCYICFILVEGLTLSLDTEGGIPWLWSSCRYLQANATRNGYVWHSVCSMSHKPNVLVIATNSGTMVQLTCFPPVSTDIHPVCLDLLTFEWTILQSWSSFQIVLTLVENKFLTPTLKVWGNKPSLYNETRVSLYQTLIYRKDREKFRSLL